ncbi:cellulose biosynthesis protein BcsN [Kaistia algarum]|uniref:cellulose biosynthesis protein BcsN n=1 Tax=Kaistia algarum TaxID=2083279 RepID=UPI0014024BB2|nr:cellulose biosynthesis protein BcsN [Kaistia algarum]MCX5516159.1 cellulose biosynthesis protein BcsN [Kaistia algarum]
MLRASQGHRVLAVCAIAVGLSACAPRPQDIETGAIASRQPLEKAMVDMPAGGPAIVGVVERRYANSTLQEIILANRARNPNQNFIKVTMFGPVKVTTGPENQFPNDPLALMNAGQEMRWFMPGVKMSVSQLYAQNRYGSFGYATGRASTGDSCLYAWQRIRAPDHDSTMISNQGTIAIRLRYCEPGASDLDLLNVMTGFTINAYFLSPGWNPYGSPPPPPDELGKPGATVLPDATAFTGSVPSVTRTVKPKVEVAPVVSDSEVYVPAISVVPTTPVDGYATVPPP